MRIGRSANGIPTTAVLAYQHSSRVLEQADASCGVDWPLIAASRRQAPTSTRASPPISTAARRQPTTSSPASSTLSRSSVVAAPVEAVAPAAVAPVAAE
jgi:hypothetical protein